MTRAARPRGPKPTRMDPDRLLDAAQAVFAEEGLRSASIRAIAQRAGCDPALLYYHFASKEALFAALLDRRFPRVLAEVAALAAARERGTAERIWDVLRVYHRHLKDDPGIRGMVRGEIVRGAEGLVHLIEARVRPVALHVRDILQQGLDRGEVRPGVQPLLGTFLLLKMQLEILDVLPVVAGFMAELPPEEAVRQGMRAWFDLYWRGIAADPLAPLPPLPDSD